MKVAIYAGSLRPGGGLTVLVQIISALLENNNNHVIVYTGAQDTTDEIKSIVSGLDNVELYTFMQGYSSHTRYLASKFYFLCNRKATGLDWLISFNYYIPAMCPVMVYHINLLSFIPQIKTSLESRVKRFDAELACRFATINIFESRYLLDVAEKTTGRPIRNPALLYVGVNRDFIQTGVSEGDNCTSYSDNTILLVSSMQVHKDNETCLRMLSVLSNRRPDIPWKMRIVGGQSVSQWDGFLEKGARLGLEEKIEVVGRVDRKTLSRMMNESLCLVSASRIESFCMVAIESMSSGCPPIVTDATSMPESVGSAAVVVQPGNAEQFAEAVLSFHDDRMLRRKYMEAGFKHAKNFTFSCFKKNLLTLLEKRTEER